MDTIVLTADTDALLEHLVAAGTLLSKPGVAANIPAGLARELRYTLAGFRASYPDHWPGTQRPLELPPVN